MSLDSWMRQPAGLGSDSAQNIFIRCFAHSALGGHVQSCLALQILWLLGSHCWEGTMGGPSVDIKPSLAKIFAQAAWMLLEAAWMHNNMILSFMRLLLETLHQELAS